MLSVDCMMLVFLEKAGALIYRWDFVLNGQVVSTVPRLLKTISIVDILGIEVGENQYAPTVFGPSVFISDVRGRKCAELSMIVLQRKNDLPEVVCAFNATPCLRMRRGWKQ
jgi:hypothetical protein